MSKLEVRNLTKAFNEVKAVDGISFSVNEREWLTLLGPSGCGKTTTLRLIAGFLKPDKGEILVDGQVISSSRTALPPEKRDMGMVFQSYAVWPNMTVFDNVAFGLQLRKMDKNEIQKKVNKGLDLVKLPDLAGRYPSELSGGQQQRVAVARSLVTQTNILLFDEPLSNLDAKLREELRFELRELQSRLGFTAVYVTHDQTEALAMSDRICIMKDGRIEQLGDPWTVYNHPHSKFVAGFVGLTNFLEGRFIEKSQEKGKIHCEQVGAILTGIVEEDSKIGEDSLAILSIRPEAIAIMRNGATIGAENILDAKVVKTTFLGNMVDYRLMVNKAELRVQELSGTGEKTKLPTEGSMVKIFLKPDKCSIISFLDNVPSSY